jgi:hypothetical protein
MVVIQNIINDSNVDEDSLSKVCQNFLNENALEDSELLIRLVSPVEIQVLIKSTEIKIRLPMYSLFRVTFQMRSKSQYLVMLLFVST